MAFQTCPGVELIPGYRLVQRLGTGGFGEVWKTTAPGGLSKALKIVFGHMEESRAAQELKALDRIKTVRHPFLLSLERVEIIDNQLLIVTELADRSLLERFQECRRSELPGIPRDELLGYIRDAAEALDYMNENFGLQHLDIKPQNLLLVGGRIKIADFGLVKDLRGGSATITGGVTPFYATPEAFDGRVSRFSDQYSLAIVYQEMLTGLRPFPGTTTLQLALQHGSSEPLLHPLPVPDRPAIARALSKTPDQRFPTCRALVASLLAPGDAGPTPGSSAEGQSKSNSGIIRRSALSIKQRRVNNLGEDAKQVSKSPTDIHDPSKPLPAQPKPADSNPLDRSDSLPLTKPASSIGLRPTLLVGIGGIAGWTLRRLRQKLHRRFGDLSAVPALRLLLLDTDRSALQQARQGEVGEALEASETLLMPLHRPQHYRSEAPEFLKWLERRWLYNIPRSLLTEGLRPLGRVALVGNLSDVLARVREALTALTSEEAKAATAAATGMELRKDIPQVFVLASIAGGTGGGAVLDLAYAVRQILREGKMAKANVCGILVHTTNQHPAEEDLARLNAYVTLNELQHFSRPSSSYPGDAFHGLSAFGPNVPPFDDCYVIHLGDHLDQANMHASTNRLAEYLYANMATSVGAFLDRWRRGSRTLAGNTEHGPPLRVFGIHRYGAPGRRLALLAADGLCGHMVDRWLGENLDCTEQSMQQEISAQITALGLDVQAIENAICAVSLSVMGNHAEKYFLEQIAGLPPSQAGANTAQRLSPQLIANILTRVDAFFARGHSAPGSEPPTVPPLETAVAKQYKELSANLCRSTAQWLTSLVDHPGRRVRGTHVAVNGLRQQISASATTVAKQLEQLRNYQTSVRKRLLSGDESNRTIEARWLGGLRMQQPQDGPCQRFAEYFLFRLKEQALTKTLNVLESVALHITEWTGELVNLDDKLRTFGRLSLQAHSALDLPSDGTVPAPAQTELLPRDAESLVDAAKNLLGRLIPKLASDLEEAFREEVLDQYGGIWCLIRSTDDRRKLVKEALFRHAFEAVLSATTELNAAHMFLESRENSDQAKEELREQACALAPAFDVPKEMQHLVIALPRSTAGAAVVEMLDPSTLQTPSTMLETDGDIIFCHEIVGVPLQSMAEVVANDPARYADVAAQVVTRIDVPWSFLEESELSECDAQAKR